MVSSMRRVRCFLCNELVSRVPTTSTSVPDNSPYSIKTLQINNKRGCICSSCLENLYSTYNILLKAKYGFSKRSSLQEIAPTQPSFKSSRDTTPAKFSDFSRDATNMQPSSGTLQQDVSFQDCIKPPFYRQFDQKAFDMLMNSLKKTFPIPVVISSSQKTFTKQVSNVTTEKKFACLDYSLDSYLAIVTSKVFGQDEAAKMLLYTIYFNQFANLLEEYGLSQDTIRKSHVLLIGNTGVGKTFLATTVANTLKIPYAFCNATSITSAGYIGGKVEEFLEELYKNADYNLELAENGILFIDEIDKKRVESNKSGRDVTGRAVQEELLKMMESSSIHLKNYNINFNPKNITIVMMGAFVGLDEIIDKRLNKKVIGFSNSTDSSKDMSVTPNDLIDYGIIPEFIGRVSVIIKMNPISKATIIDIIYSLLDNFNIIFKIKKVDLIVDDFFIDALAEELLSSSTGARDIYSKLFNILSPALYQIFQSNGDGICQIDAFGNTELLITDADKKAKVFYFDSKFTFAADDFS